MLEPRVLAELFTVGERFRRSVNISADYQDTGNLDDYIVTSLSATTLSRIGRGLSPNSGRRAWSITGPYGAGKSAAALFLAETLRYPVNQPVRELVMFESPDLMKRLYHEIPGLDHGGFLIATVVGAREPISQSLVAGLLQLLRRSSISSPAFDDQLHHLRSLHRQAKVNKKSRSKEVAQAVCDTARIACSSHEDVLGLLVIYDELGRALEYAALHPEDSDIGILQTVAEMATRSEDAPFGLVTILHQSFENYAAHLSPARQREWAKIQGRFEDIPFIQSPGDLLTLVDKAISPVQPLSEGLDRLMTREVEEAQRIDFLPPELDRQEALRIVRGCSPLHPTTTALLGRVFRSQISQNERSLFAFLSSREPFGLQEHLEHSVWSDNDRRPFYRIHNFYDYIKAAMGSRLYTQARGKQWAEIEDALDRLPREAGDTEACLIKTIGLLGLFGDQRYLNASRRVLTYSLVDGHATQAEDIHRALERLQEWGLVVYRRFKQAYSLWQGSDVDLDERFEDGLAHVDRSQSLAQLLQGRGQIKPYVAKRHLHETGSYRYFTPWVVALDDLHTVRDRSLGGADGAVVFVLAARHTPAPQVESQIAHHAASLDPPRRDLIVFAIPEETKGLREAFDEILAWEWVAENTPELEGDSTARRELAARRFAAHERFSRASARSFEAFSAYRSCTWIWRGHKQPFSSARDLSAFFSQVCDEVYASAPIVDNELVNRRDISSAIVAARRTLAAQMLTNADQARLGIEGYPPEISIYLSVLQRSGLHQQRGDSWAFGPPPENDPCQIKPLWRAIDDFLTTTEQDPRPVEDLYDVLKTPPFGVREGVLPLYLIAAMLYWRSEVALYERGSFIPEVGFAQCERLMKLPETFSIQRYRLDDAHQRMLYEYSMLFDDELAPTEISQLKAVRPIIAFANQLPRYTQITHSLSQKAVAVREALLSAREPQRLLLEDLPQALDFEAPEIGTEEIETYFADLKQCLVELQSAYDKLLLKTQKQLVDALLLSSDLEAARHEIAPRAQLLHGWIADLELRAFVSRLGDDGLANREWLESVASCLVHKPPRKWNDDDVLASQLALADLAARFRRTEEVALSETQVEYDDTIGHALRLSVTDGTGQEQSEMVRMTPDCEEVVSVLRNALQSLPEERKTRIMAVAALAKEVLNRPDSLQRADEQHARQPSKEAL